MYCCSGFKSICDVDGWGRVVVWGSVVFEEKLDCCGGFKGICGVNVRG